MKRLKPGPKPKPRGEVRTKLLTIRVTESEMHAIQAAGGNAEQREVLLRWAKRVR